jgi:copper chaperone CopZ
MFIYIENKRTMETIKLTIPNMKSQHCQITVTRAVKSLGASVKSISPMQVEIELQNNVSRHALISTIETAGYTVSK